MSRKFQKKKKRKLIRRGKNGEPTVIDFNLSKAVIIAIVIGVIIVTITAVRIITTLIEAREENQLAEAVADSSNVSNASWVKSEDGIWVPIPNGYVASGIPGETSVSTGFVIYEETEEGINWANILVEDETEQEQNIYDLQTSTNQWVWVPVSTTNISRIFGVDSNGKLWGKLYEFPTSDTGSRSELNWTESSGLISITSLTTSYREPDVTNYLTSYDIDSLLQSYSDGVARGELLSKELEESFYLMIKSIEEYGGFYIGRYETGGVSGTAVVQKMNSDISGESWYTLYEKNKELSGENGSIITSMIWGCLWDETLQWLIDSEATLSDGVTKLTYSLVGNDSTDWGNYRYSTFSYIIAGSESPNTTTNKNYNSSVKIPTGSADYTKVNNIYDLAGNVYDFTLEASATTRRTCRAGYYYSDGSNVPASYRGAQSPTTENEGYGSRAILLIKS